MGLRVATNIPSLITQRNIEANSKDLGRSIARLSSGKKITNAADDAAGLAIGTRLDAEVRGLAQAQRNANDGASFVQTAEGGLNEVSNILVRLRELGVQAASDTVGDEERGFINKEYNVLKDEIDRIANVTQYGGKSLLNGSGGDLTFQVGANKGENNVISFNAGDTNASASKLGISGAQVSSKDDAVDSLESVDEAISKVNSYRASLGGMQNRLHSASNNLGSQIDNFSEAKSRIVDTDMAVETANLAKSSILQNAGIAVLAQANAAPSSAMKLL